MLKLVRFERHYSGQKNMSFQLTEVESDTLVVVQQLTLVRMSLNAKFFFLDIATILHVGHNSYRFIPQMGIKWCRT